MNYIRSLKHKELIELGEIVDGTASSWLEKPIKMQKMLDHIVRSGYSTGLVDHANEILRTINGAELNKEEKLEKLRELEESTDFKKLKKEVCDLVAEQTKRNSKCNIL